MVVTGGNGPKGQTRKNDYKKTQKAETKKFKAQIA